MNKLSSLVNEFVSIKNPIGNESGFGVIRTVDKHKNIALVSMFNGAEMDIDVVRLIVQPTQTEAIKKLEFRIKDWYNKLDGCAEKDCFVCIRKKNELDEALNLIELLKVL